MIPIGTPGGTDTITTRLYSFGVTIGGALNAPMQKIKVLAKSPVGQGIIGAALGVGMHKVYAPLTKKILKALGTSPSFSSPLNGPFISSPLSDLGFKILIMPLICVIIPYAEEKIFRGDIQETLKIKFKLFVGSFGFSDSAANISACVMSIFFASVIFGLYHFSNAIFLWCNPILFLPQVVASTISGTMCGLAKEFSGDLFLPLGMHIGNNTFAWGEMMLDLLGKIKSQ